MIKVIKLRKDLPINVVFNTAKREITKITREKYRIIDKSKLRENLSSDNYKIKLFRTICEEFVLQQAITEIQANNLCKKYEDELNENYSSVGYVSIGNGSCTLDI